MAQRAVSHDVTLNGEAGQATAGQPVVAAYTAHSDVERDLIEAWSQQAYPHGVELLPATRDGLTERLRRGDDPLVVPVRVAWLPRERDGGGRRAGLADVLTLTNPRRPWSGLQKRIARGQPDRCPVVVGEPARARDLHRRWVRDAGGRGGAGGFAAWVARQAVLAVERAERGLVGDRYKVPRLVAEQVTDSARFRDQVTALAGKLELPEQEVWSRATAALKEMVAVQSRLAIDLFAAVMSPLHTRAWDVRVDVDSLEALREVNRRTALAFLPSHRSYSDPLVLAKVLDDHDFPGNHIMGGNNMAFWPIGPLGRRAGLVFIRRSFRDDEVYKLALREYIAFLVAKRFNLEWYMEGGRSRTGKLHPPRYGLLRYLIEAVRSQKADVCMVPVSITYDQLSEVSAMADEQRGATKQSEGLGWLAQYIRAQQHRTGSVQVRFGAPFSLSEALDDDDPRAMEKVAFEVNDRINRVTPVVATSLVTLALLGVRDRALTLSEVRSVLEPLLDYVEARELPVGEGVERLRRGGGVGRTLEALAREGVVTAYTEGTEPVYAIESGRHHVAAFYRNSGSHWFVNRAIAELAVLAGGGDGDQVRERTLALRDVLKHEFFFAAKDTFHEQLEAELNRLDPDWETKDPRAVLGGTRILLAHRVLRPFLDAYAVVAERLAARDPRQAVDKSAFLAECVAVGQQMLLQRRLHSPESVSRELFSTGLELTTHRDLVDPGREELAERRRAFADEIAELVKGIEAASVLDEEREHVAA